MSVRTSIIKRTPLLLAAGASAFLLTGCFATQQDLDPMRSDISVLEKQFMEVQKDCARAKYAEEPGANRDLGAKLDETSSRLAALEKRMDALEAKVRQAQAEPPEPSAPQPIPAEPSAGAPAAPEGAAPDMTAPQPTQGMVAAGDAFNVAKQAFDAGDYEKAEADFRQFLTQYPKDRLADDAEFYLGEIYFNKKDYNKAIGLYESVVKDYPLADRVPDALFREGMAYEALNNADKARELYNRVMDNYPYSEAAGKESQRLGQLK